MARLDLIVTKELIERARALHQEEGTTEIDDDAEVSRSDDPDAGGCYVRAWVWVPDEEEES